MKQRFDPRRVLKAALILGGVGLAANVGFYSFVVRDRVRQFEDLEGARASFERELTTAEDRTAKLRAYHESLVTSENNIRRFYKEILGAKQDTMIAVQREIAEIAERYGIDPETVSMENADLEEDGLEKLEMEIPIEGDYTNLRSFIEDLENSERFVLVDRISLTGTKEGGLQLLLNVNVSTYFDAPWLKKLKQSDKPARRRA